MATIKSKRKSVIKKGAGYVYIPETFAKTHAVSNFYEVDSAEEMLERVKPFAFRDKHLIVFDTETYATSLASTYMPKSIVRRWVGKGKKAHPQDFPFCISICDGINAYSLYDTLDNKFRKFKALAPLFEDRSIDKIAHNVKFDMHQLANIGMKIRGMIHDTVVIAKLANENRPSFTLRDLAMWIKGGIVKFEYMVDNYKAMNKVTDYRQIPKELLTQYANADVWNAFLEFMDDYEILERDDLMELYNNEMALTIALWAEERFGMRVDPMYEKPLKDDLQQLTDEAEDAVYSEAGTIFNANSGKQLYNVLLKLGVNRDLISMTEKGNPCLDKNALSKLADKHKVPVVQKILEHRKYEKLLNTYAVGIYSQRDSRDRVHGSINQTEATTGRMSITKPALQTLPKKDKRIRRAFVPADDFGLCFMDLDQIEYRLFAHYAKAIGLIEAIKSGHDVHQATGAIIYNILYDLVTEVQRTKAKTVNFSLIYGQGDEASADSLKMTIAEARAFKEHYFAMIPEARPFIQMVQRITRTRGYIMNRYKRRRRLTHDEVYKATNALIQGCAADYIKHKIVLIYKFLAANNYRTRMINCVHDELVVEYHFDEKHLLPKVRYLMSDFETFRVPITAGVEYGNPSWGEKVLADDVGFVEPTQEELTNMNSFDIFDGSVFDIVK